jgi:hypothetical protein
MTAAVGELLAWVTEGSALAALGKVLLAVCALVLGLIYRRYLGILSADRKKPAERQAYEALRASLTSGNLATRLYARWLTALLDGVDRFFGDADKADQTLFPHAFGLKTPASLWTAPSLERCLLLALIYPLATIFIIWAVSGHVGPAEAALHLNPHLIAWQRWLAAAVIGLSVVALCGAVRATGWARVTRTVFCIAAFVIAIALAVAQAGATIVGSAHAAEVTTRVNIVVTRAVTIVVAFLGAVSVAATIAVVSAGLDAIRRFADTAGHRWEGLFLSLFIPIMIVACLGAAIWLPPLTIWQILGSLLLFLALLTLLNAPFDWFSLGLTRALLRRGLELGGWWPYALALTDAALAAVIIAALALTMVVGVQAFDVLAVHGGGTPVLPLEPLFSGIGAHPSAPEYWWLYALLLSTMIPSLVNLVIGGTSLVRGLPRSPSLLLRYIPERGGVLKWDRHWIATVLTAQVALGAVLGIAAQVFLVWVIIGYVMPFFGLELLGMARDVAAFNVPARVVQLFGVSL